MKSIAWLLMLLPFSGPLLAAPGSAPPPDSICLKVELINALDRQLDTLHPFEGNEADLIDSLNTRLTELLLQVLNDEQGLQYDIAGLLQLPSLASADGKLRIFHFFENTGGSYKSMVNVVQCILPNGKPKAERLMDCSQNKWSREDYYGLTLEQLILLKTNNGPRYLAIGGGVTCNTCYASSVVLLKIDEEGLQPVFCTSFDYRSGDGSVTYSPKTKTISYTLVVHKDDSLFGTDCADGEPLPDNRCRYKGQYRFNGVTFVEVPDKAGGNVKLKAK